MLLRYFLHQDRMQTSLRTALRDRDSQAAEAERYSRKIRILESELSSSMGVGRIVGAETEEDSTKTALMNANAQLKKVVQIAFYLRIIHLV